MQKIRLTSITRRSTRGFALLLFDYLSPTSLMHFPTQSKTFFIKCKPTPEKSSSIRSILSRLQVSALPFLDHRNDTAIKHVFIPLQILHLNLRIVSSWSLVGPAKLWPISTTVLRPRNRMICSKRRQSCSVFGLKGITSSQRKCLTSNCRKSPI